MIVPFFMTLELARVACFTNCQWRIMPRSREFQRVLDIWHKYESYVLSRNLLFTH